MGSCGGRNGPDLVRFGDGKPSGSLFLRAFGVFTGALGFDPLLIY